MSVSSGACKNICFNKAVDRKIMIVSGAIREGFEGWGTVGRGG
jgi:hypothetical protein